MAKTDDQPQQISISGSGNKDLIPWELDSEKQWTKITIETTKISGADTLHLILENDITENLGTMENILGIVDPVQDLHLTPNLIMENILGIVALDQNTTENHTMAQVCDRILDQPLAQNLDMDRSQTLSLKRCSRLLGKFAGRLKKSVLQYPNQMELRALLNSMAGNMR